MVGGACSPTPRLTGAVLKPESTGQQPPITTVSVLARRQRRGMAVKFLGRPLSKCAPICPSSLDVLTTLLACFATGVCQTYDDRVTVAADVHADDFAELLW